MANPTQEKIFPSLRTSQPMRSQWILTPQSFDPSPSASKPASVILPSRESVQIPTPAQSASMAAAGTGIVMRDVSHAQFSGRGKRLTLAEEESLVRICKLSMEGYDIEQYQKSFWIEISRLLQLETGRSYSWQSCRRRMAANLTGRLRHKTALELAMPPPVCDVRPEICEMVDRWIEECDAKLEAEIERKEMEQRLEQRRVDAEEEKERLEVEGHRRSKQTRVMKWVESLPHPEDMKPLLQWGNYPRRSLYKAGPTRSRSRSPRHEGNTNYRQRSRSPTGVAAIAEPRGNPLSSIVLGAWHRHADTVGFNPLKTKDEAPEGRRGRRSPTSDDLPETPVLLDRNTRRPAANPMPESPLQGKDTKMHDAPALAQRNRSNSLPSNSLSEHAERYMEKTRASIAEYVAKMAVRFTRDMAPKDVNERNYEWKKGVELAVHGLLKDVGVAYVSMVNKIMHLEPAREA